MIYFSNSISTKSLATKRGRSFFMSTAIVLLVKDGPINTLEQNVQQVAQSLTCMYEQVRGCTLQVSLCVLMYKKCNFEHQCGKFEHSSYFS